jgi:YidC/Oxa1 family membrane protein insertase
VDFLADPLAPLLAGFYAIVSSYGLAIILLTLAVRILLLPLSIKSTRSMREMQVIQPEVKRLQKKYKNDRQKMNVEVMALYKEHGVNPFGGCLPLLLQMPVFIALFYLVRAPLEYLASNVSLATDMKQRALEVHNFLGIRLDCTPVDAYSGRQGQFEGITEVCSSGGIVGALPYFLLIALMGATTWYQQKQMTSMRSGQTDPQQQQMQTFMKIMPFILVFFGFSFPIGVILYWITTNLWTIVQQRIMLRAAPPIAVGAGSTSTKGDKGDKGSGPAKKAAATDSKRGKSTSAKGKPGQPPKKTPEKKSPTGGANRSQSRKKKK